MTQTLIITAFYDSEVGPSVPKFWDVAAYFGTVAEREEVLAWFPKSYGLRPSTLSTMRPGEIVDGYRDRDPRTWTLLPSITGHAKLWSDGVNGGRNETGIKRLHKILAVAERHGMTVEVRKAARNGYETLADLLAAIG